MISKIRIWIRRLEIRVFRRSHFLASAMGIYLLALATFSFFGNRGLWSSFRLWRECQKLDIEIHQLKRDVRNLSDQVDLFRDDHRAIEKYAREELHLAGDREIHYIFK